MKDNLKSQSAVEFFILIGVLFFIFLIFLYLFQSDLAGKSDKRKDEMIKEIDEIRRKKNLQMQQLQDVKQAAEQGYDKGVIDALAAAYQQTANCQVTTITLGNVTRRIIDVDCVQEAAGSTSAG